MRDTVKVDWKVPEAEWERFQEFVEEKHGSLDGYLGYEAESAMKEYADLDGGDVVEGIVDDFVRAAGRRPENGYGDDLNAEDTTRVQVRVDELVKDEFRKTAKQNDHETFGKAFARAIRTHCDGGRYGRLERKLSRVKDDAEDLLSEMNPSSEDGGLSAVERRTITICNRLPDQFTDDELVEEISDVAGSGARASNPTIEQYRELVTGRLDVEPHPNAPKTVWVPEEVAADLAPEGTPRVCRQPVELLDRDERIRRLQLVVGRRAAKRSTGRVRVNTSDIREDVFEHDVSKSSVLDLMEAAAVTRGFTLDRNSETASLRVDLNTVADADPELFETIIEYRDGDAGDLLGDTTETTVTDYADGDSPSGPSSPDDVASQMDALTNAVTDGGGPSRDYDRDGDD